MTNAVLWGNGSQLCRKLLTAFAAVAMVAGVHSAFADDPYIQSDGTQAINTGYHFNGKTKIVVHSVCANNLLRE